MRAVSLSRQMGNVRGKFPNPANHLFIGLAAVSILTVSASINPITLAVPITLAAVVYIFSLSTRITDTKQFISLVLLVFAVFILEAVFRVRDYSDKSVDWQVLLKALSLLALLGLAMLRINDTLPAVINPTRVVWFVFFAWICFSAIYAPNVAYGFFGAFSLFSFYLFLLFVFRNFDETHVILALIAAIFLFCLVSLLVYFALPDFGRMKIWYGNEQVTSNRLSGIGGNANTAGRQAALALLLLVLYAKELKALNRHIVPAVAVVAGLALLLSNSRTSMALLFVILWFLWFCNKQRWGMFLVSLLVGIFSLPLVFLFGETILAAISRSGDISEITTGTGRSYIWSVVVQLIAERPWLGWGYGSTLFILPEYSGDIRHTAPHAHNMILQILVTTGFVGLALFALALFIRLFDAWRARNRTVLAMMAFVLLNGLTEASAFAGVANSATLALMIAIAVPLGKSLTSRPRN
ncbi:MAG: O-antigen ligase family protein [Pseudomonadota bacterium]